MLFKSVDLVILVAYPWIITNLFFHYLVILFHCDFVKLTFVKSSPQVSDGSTKGQRGIETESNLLFRDPGVIST